MILGSTSEAGSERYLSRGQVAGRLLATIGTVQRWIDQGRMRTVPGPRGHVCIPESALLEFERQASRRENFSGIDHGLHSRPVDYERIRNLPVAARSAEQVEADAPRWPFPPAADLSRRD